MDAASSGPASGPTSPAVNSPARGSREAALALAKQKLAAKKRENRQKSGLVLAIAIMAIFVPALLIAGLDLSGLFYPPPAPAPPLSALPGDHVTLSMVGYDENGTVFMPPGTYNATLGDGTLVPGLDRALEGLPAGTPFNVTVSPADGYGFWAQNRTSTVARTSERERLWETEREGFERTYGTPSVGMVVATPYWNSTVIEVSDSHLKLRYEPRVGDVVDIYRYWNSTVTGYDREKIFLENDLWVGYSYTRYSRQWRANLTYVVTGATGSRFTLDANPPLVGKTLHFVGTVVDVRPGSGARQGSGTAMVLSAQDCARCHAGEGFVAMDAGASAVRVGSEVEVNVTVDNPWLHDLTGANVTVQVGGPSQTPAAASEALGTLGPASSTGAALRVPAAPGNASVTVVINGTAHHVHRSGGPPTDADYQLSFTIDVGGSGREPPAAGGKARGTGPWLLIGQIIGAAALAVMAYPIGMGLKRHAKLRPRLKWPPWPWVTTHFTLSLIVVAVACVHGVVLMSTKYRGLWTPEVLAGVVALAAVGALGFSGIIMAKWTDVKWKPARKVHFALMLAVVGGLVVHVLVAGTTVRGLLGL